MSEQKVALVTGVSSGIGRRIAEELVTAGFRAYGSVRSAVPSLPPGVTAAPLDVRDEASIHAAVDAVLAEAGHIDLLVNNAGAALIGAIEETDVAQAQALLDVNFFGSVRMTAEV